MTEMLEGITVLDLASVGPAARASRWLADYGATVVKVGPVPKDTGVQITPPFYAYSAHRRMQRALVDMKSAEGREAFLRLVERSQVAHARQCQGQGQLGDRFGEDPLAARPLAIVLDEMDERLDAGVRQLHPADVFVGGQHTLELVGITRLRPHQRLGLGNRHHLSTSGRDGAAQPVLPTFRIRADRDSRRPGTAGRIRRGLVTWGHASPG